MENTKPKLLLPTNCFQNRIIFAITSAYNIIAIIILSISGNTDIHNGNLKLILGLIWSLIAHYQLGASNFPPKKLMLAWLKVRQFKIDFLEYKAQKVVESKPFETKSYFLCFRPYYQTVGSKTLQRIGIMAFTSVPCWITVTLV